MAKWIKKVAVTPLNAIAKVINSLTGDSTQDAPSVHIVKTALAEKVASDDVTEIQVVAELPDDASSHTTTLYLIPEE